MTPTTHATTTRDDVLAAIEAVCDPEYPGVSIADLGLVHDVRLRRDGTVEVDLVPTFSGCPALQMIVDDVHAAVTGIAEVTGAEVQMMTAPVWTPDRITERGRRALADSFTVAVQIGTAAATCPRCGTETTPQSLFGPTRCRSVHRCSSCDEIVEVLR